MEWKHFDELSVVVWCQKFSSIFDEQPLSCFTRQYHLFHPYIWSVILYDDAYSAIHKCFHSKVERPYQSLINTLPSTAMFLRLVAPHTSLVGKCLSGGVICLWFCYPVLAALACGWITPPHWVITDQLAHNRVSTTTSCKWSTNISSSKVVNRRALEKEDLPSFHDGPTKWKDEYLRTFFRRFVGRGEEFESVPKFLSLRLPPHLWRPPQFSG